jgi:hypothetical protein
MHVSHAKKSAASFAMLLHNWHKQFARSPNPSQGAGKKLISVAASVAMRVCFPIRPCKVPTPCKNNLERSAGRSGSSALASCRPTTLSNVVGDLLHRTQTQCLKVRALVHTLDEREREQVRQRRDKSTSFAWAQRLYFAEPMENSPAVERVIVCAVGSSPVYSGSSEVPSNEDKPPCSACM